ncbi:MFS transporter [Arthrobacter sp. NA-172]|uniref:MFS transporter n=1 Tax=Arthrobacter sp. NA-172 TaxID=3367524 RepID=UPI003755089C
MGDRMGRKNSMMLSISLASLGSLIISVSPGYATIGGWASFVLVGTRLLQGLAHGGEFPTAQTYIAEVVPAPSRGFWSSTIYVSATAGIVFATVLGAILSSFINAEAMASFGWRVPFAVGAVLGIYTLIMRRRMSESEAFEENKTKEATLKTSLWTSVAQHWREALQVIGLTLGLTIAFYTWNVSAPSMAINAHKLNLSEALWAGTVANLLFLFFLPFWGWVSDKIGRKPVLAIGFLGAAAAHFPAISLIDNTGLHLVVGMTIVTFFIAAVASIIPAVFAEIFPTAIRNVGVAVPYSICVAAFGGTAAFIQAGLNQAMGAASGATFFGISIRSLAPRERDHGPLAARDPRTQPPRRRPSGSRGLDDMTPWWRKDYRHANRRHVGTSSCAVAENAEAGQRRRDGWGHLREGEDGVLQCSRDGGHRHVHPSGRSKTARAHGPGLDPSTSPWFLRNAGCFHSALSGSRRERADRFARRTDLLDQAPVDQSKGSLL